MSEIIIKKGNMQFCKVDRKNLISCDATHDGVVFALKGGIQIYCTDPDMPIYSKDIMRNTSNSFANADLIFDLLNYKQPVSATPTIKK
jgi:hypothetical protein